MYNNPTEEEIIKWLPNATKTLNLILNNKRPEKNVWTECVNDLERCINFFESNYISYYFINEKLKTRLQKLQYKLDKLGLN